jgi:hypothetical protein
MRETRISLPELGLIAMTRGALGVGIGLLISGALGASARRAVGWALVVAGGLTTIPLALEVLQKSRMSNARGAGDPPSGSNDRPRSGPVAAHS